MQQIKKIIKYFPTHFVIRDPLNFSAELNYPNLVFCILMLPLYKNKKPLGKTTSNAIINESVSKTHVV